MTGSDQVTWTVFHYHMTSFNVPIILSHFHQFKKMQLSSSKSAFARGGSRRKRRLETCSCLVSRGSGANTVVCLLSAQSTRVCCLLLPQHLAQCDISE